MPRPLLQIFLRKPAALTRVSACPFVCARFAMPMTRRNLLFWLLTALAPLLILALLEGGLRLLGVGQPLPLFIDAKGMPGYLQANSATIERYFPAGHAPDVSIDTIYFRKEKPPGSLRIVVQGGSSAAGFPYGRWGGLAGMLQDRLENDVDGRHIEVITTAMSAINSYSLLDFAAEISAIKPDAVLIYAGHNEYVGVMGAGSALSSHASHGAKLLMLKLRQLRLYQLAQRLLAPLTLDDSAGERGTLMARAASQQQIPYGSALYEQGLAQFGDNMQLLLQHYQRARIPVFISTLASNERQQPPFAGEPTITGASWQKGWQHYRSALESGQLDAAKMQLQQLLAADDNTANLWFALGQLEWQQGNFAAARQAYTKARDRDQLRFRAPTAVNAQIRQLAQRYGATLVDGEGRLRAACAGGIIDNSVMLEHLHPNARGYFLLADAFYQALRQHPRLGGWPQRISTEQAWQERPITAVDDWLAALKIAQLKADYPFSRQRQQYQTPAITTVPEQIAAKRASGELDWLKAQQSMLAHYRQQGDGVNALRAARMLAQAFPNQFGPSFATGALLLGLNDGRRASRYLEQAMALDERQVEGWKALVFAYGQQGDKKAASHALQRAALHLPAEIHQQLQARIAALPGP